jgi:hypothetical protein
VNSTDIEIDAFLVATKLTAMNRGDNVLLLKSRLQQQSKGHTVQIKTLLALYKLHTYASRSRSTCNALYEQSDQLHGHFFDLRPCGLRASDLTTPASPCLPSPSRITRVL